MGDDKFVTKEMCDVVNANIKESINEIKDSIRNIGDDVNELTVISAKLTQLQEIQSATLITVNKRLSSLEDTQNRVVGALELRVKALEDTPKVSKKKFWETKTGEYIIKAGVIILIMIVMAAIGQNYLEDLKPLIGK